MKIDEMLQREDFFNILRRTLIVAFDTIDISIIDTNGKNVDGQFLIYSKLNAIISGRHSKQVQQFLSTEYSVNGSLLRRIIVKAYIKFALITNGLISHKLKVYVNKVSPIDYSNILIYPCNKKIRVFYFDRGIVEVFLKEGFPAVSITHEIQNRLKYLSENIEPVIKHGETWYQEKIIEGKPLARISNKSIRYLQLKKKSLEVLRSITAPYQTLANSKNYKDQIIGDIIRTSDILFKDDVSVKNRIQKILGIIEDNISKFDEEITLTLSHGDFHHGNIWIENQTDRIVIIDWETADIRSEYYDVFTLFGGLREIDGIKKLFSKHAPEIGLFISTFRDRNENLAWLVFLEDLQFRINDIQTVPVEIGLVEFVNYCDSQLLFLGKIGY